MFAGAADSRTGQVWGGLRNLGLSASIASAVGDLPGAPAYLRTRYGCCAASQLNYILGDTGRSFIVGQGVDPPQFAHSRDAFCRLGDTRADCSLTLWRDQSYPNPNVRVCASCLQRKVMITKHQFARQLIRGSTVIPKYALNSGLPAPCFTGLVLRVAFAARCRSLLQLGDISGLVLLLLLGSVGAVVSCRATNVFHSSACGVQILVGAMVSGPAINDVFSDVRVNHESTEVALDYQTSLIMLLTAVLQLPGQFWQGGDLAQLTAVCHDNFFRQYPWQ